MTQKELKKLSRAELLELLLNQTRKVESLNERLSKAEAEIENRRLKVESAGDLAHAVLEINAVMEAAQAAAKQYVENIEISCREEYEKIIAEAKGKAEKIIEEARLEAERIKNR